MINVPSISGPYYDRCSIHNWSLETSSFWQCSKLSPIAVFEFSDDVLGMVATNDISCFWCGDGWILLYFPEKYHLYISHIICVTGYEESNLLWGKRIVRSNAPFQSIHIHQFSLDSATSGITAASYERFFFVICHSIGFMMRIWRSASRLIDISIKAKILKNWKACKNLHMAFLFFGGIEAQKHNWIWFIKTVARTTI